jgi:hypothetical protein
MQWTREGCRPLAIQLISTIRRNLAGLPPDKNLPARKLCGDYWHTLSTAERRFAGRFIAASVRRRLLELDQVGKNSGNHWLYRLR